MITDKIGMFYKIAMKKGSEPEVYEKTYIMDEPKSYNKEYKPARDVRKVVKRDIKGMLETLMGMFGTQEIEITMKLKAKDERKTGE
jgi:hypothetical protein